jgi:hypothetical protein
MLSVRRSPFKVQRSGFKVYGLRTLDVQDVMDVKDVRDVKDVKDVIDVKEALFNIQSTKPFMCYY